MGRPRKPTKVLELNGAYKKNPQRKKERANEMEVNTLLGGVPAHLSEAQKATWLEIVNAAPEGLLGNTDYTIVEMVAVELTKYRNDQLGVGEKALLISLLGKLGYSPADRSKVQMPEKKKESKWTRHAK